MTKKIITEKTSYYLENLIDEIPIEQRKRMVKVRLLAKDGWILLCSGKYNLIIPLNDDKVKK
jgi:hypothetical protein